MRLLAAVERFLERTLERSTARFFRVPLQPIQIERRLERALESARVTRPGGPLVPDRYRVALNPGDLRRLGVAPAELADGLAAMVLAVARRRGYRVAARPRVEIVASPRVAAGDVRVESAFERGRGPSPAASSPSPVAEATGYLPRPVATPPARLVVRTADGRRTSVPLAERPVTIGRAPDNVVRIDDPRVSRHHARIVLRDGRPVLVDEGSTNGTWVDGLRVTELALGAGDRIEIGGAAELRIELEPPAEEPADPGPR